MTKDINNKTNRELIIRIDERVKSLQDDVKVINNKLDKKVDVSRCNDHYRDFLQIKQKVAKHEKNWDRLSAYAVGLTVGGGAIGGIAANFVRAVFAKVLP